MNLILLRPEEIHNRQVILTDHRAEHITTVLKSKPGGPLRTGIVNGPMSNSKVLEVTENAVVLEVSTEAAFPRDRRQG